MKGCRKVNALLAALVAGAGSILVCANLALAGVEDSRFEFSADGTSVEFDVQDTPRREVMSRLFAGTDIEIRWISSAFANEPMTGKFSGTSAAVARQLLGQMNFVIVHDNSGDKSRVVRVLIVGQAKGEQSWAGLSAIAAAMQPSGRRAPENKGVPVAPVRPDDAKARVAGVAPSATDLPILSGEMGSVGDARALLKPAPAGATAPFPVLAAGAEPPRLIPPPADRAVPFTPAPAGTSPPLAPTSSGRADK